MIIDGFVHQLPDTDPAGDRRSGSTRSTRWSTRRARPRAQYLMARLTERARERQVGTPAPSVSTPYVNTIPHGRASRGSPATRTSSGASAPTSAGTPRSMVVQANKQADGIGGHLSTFASSAALYEVGFNHFFRGKDDGLPGDHVYIQGHAAPGIYARAFLEGRLDEADLDSFRREVDLPDRPDGACRPTRTRGSCPTSGSSRRSRWASARSTRSTRPGSTSTSTTAASTTPPAAGCGASSATARPTSPRRSARSRSPAREQLDNLTWVVNCNLQRLDGPVRGNGKIIQELEAIFRGAGWNVIKVIWGSRLGRAARPRRRRRAARQDEHHRRRRVPALRARVGRLHPRPLLRPRPAAAQAGRAPDRRRPPDPAPRRPRLPEALRRLQGRDRDQGRADGDPGQDGQGLDARARRSRAATPPTRSRR